MAASRRTFLQQVGAGTLAAGLSSTIQRALAVPAHNQHGSIEDVEHIVFLMQENRSFDHYFGTLRGVRGFGDPRAVVLPSGDPVWYQPNGGARQAPFRPDAPGLGLAFLEDLPHDWKTTHQAWNGGKYDQWIPSKGTTTMAYLTRNDIPFHYALADAFTVCDAYYCSFLGATDPNRYHMWTGWIGNDGQGGGPVLDNAEAGYDWSTFPERLTAADISWKIYQDVGAGLDAAHFWGWGDDPYIGNYGDNSLLYFHQYQNAAPGSPLDTGARRGTDVKNGGNLVDQFRQDVQNNQLPRVSWIVAPEAYTEHPNWPANYGAWYIAQFLDALTANPAVWSKTALFLMYDENDGFFDHQVPPTPPQSRAEGLSTVETTNEVFGGNATYAAGPFGLGVRVPMIVVSPWSKGGWVSSEVFDHTSLIQFVERRFGAQHPHLRESNITAWRRAVTGDLTSAFNFRTPNDAVVTLPSTDGYAPPDRDKHPDYVPAAPAALVIPRQEPGIRPARPVPYELDVLADVQPAAGTVALHFGNTGRAAAVFHVRSGGGDGPWTYTVGARAALSETWELAGKPGYDLSVHGPNGFFRSWKGSLTGSHKANLAVSAMYDADGCAVALEIRNRGAHTVALKVHDGYGGSASSRTLQPDEGWTHTWPLETSHGWYDLTITVASDPTFRQQLSGHLETGRDSMTDPALG